jgi:hypothetical protein
MRASRRSRRPVGGGAALSSACAGQFLQKHLSAASVLPAEKVRWRDGYETEKATETSALTWKGYCDEIAESGKGFAAAVDLLSAYAESLKARNDRMTATAKSLSTVGDVIDIATSAISVVAKVIVMLG